MNVECDNCQWKGELTDDVPEISDFWGRTDPGCEMPAAQCPECGGLVYDEHGITWKRDQLLEAARAVVAALAAYKTGDAQFSQEPLYMAPIGHKTPYDKLIEAIESCK